MHILTIQHEIDSSRSLAQLIRWHQIIRTNRCKVMWQELLIWIQH